MAKKTSSFRLGSCFFSTLTVVVLLVAIGLVLFYAYVFIFPDSEFNPFPPTGIPLTEPVMMTPTTEVTLEPVVTIFPTATEVPATETVAPTSTFVPPTYTPTPDVPEETPTALPTPTPSYFAYDPQQGSPVALSSEIFYPELGCNTMIIAGQVFNKDGIPIVHQDMILFGDIDGNDVWHKTRTGDPALNRIYGPGAYEFRVADAPVATSGYFSVAMIDQENYLQSAKIQIVTHGDCDANLILLNFAEKDD